MNSFDLRKFKDSLATESFGREAHCFANLDSTNRLAKDLALQGLEEGNLVVAEHQSQGRGRWGRNWESQAGLSLLFSVLLRPSASAPASQLTAVAGVAVQRVLTRYAPAARLKWPNDVWVDRRKLSGLLLESSGGAVIVGMGLNVNQGAGDFSPGLQAVSLKQCCGREIEREALLADLLLEMERAYKHWQSEGFESTRRAWDEKACFIGEMVKAGQGQTGRALGLDSQGGLMIENESGTLHLVSGEVSLLRPA